MSTELPDGISVFTRVTEDDAGTFTLTMMGLGIVLSGFASRDDALSWANDHLLGLAELNRQSNERRAIMAAQHEEHRRGLNAALLSDWEPSGDAKKH
jgi:hypothetical protein